MLVWVKKKMSGSDAQVKMPVGWPVPYLRFTRIGNTFDTQTWFQNHFFAGERWTPSTFGNPPKGKEIWVDFKVTIGGVSRGKRNMRVTHDPSRAKTGKNTPNTYLHYDDLTLQELRAQSYKHHKVEVKRDDEGGYHFTIYP